MIIQKKRSLEVIFTYVVTNRTDENTSDPSFLLKLEQRTLRTMWCPLAFDSQSMAYSPPQRTAYTHIEDVPQSMLRLSRKCATEHVYPWRVRPVRELSTIYYSCYRVPLT